MHRLLKPFLNFFLYSNVFIALAFACLGAQTFLSSGKNIDYNLLLFIFFSSVFIYSFHRSYGLVKGDFNQGIPPHLFWIKNNKKIMVLIFTLAVPCVFYTLFRLTINHFIVLVPLAIITFGYTLKVLLWNGNYISLREIPGLKSFLISFVVACITVLMPAISIKQEDIISDQELILRFAERFFFIVALSIPFDIRDIKRDKEREITSLPILVGANNAKVAAVVSLLFSLIAYGFILMQGSPDLMVGAAVFISYGLTVFLIVRSSAERNDYYYSFGLDSMMFLQALPVCIWLG